MGCYEISDLQDWYVLMHAGICRSRDSGVPVFIVTYIPELFDRYEREKERGGEGNKLSRKVLAEFTFVVEIAVQCCVTGIFRENAFVSFHFSSQRRALERNDKAY